MVSVLENTTRNWNSRKFFKKICDWSYIYEVAHEKSRSFDATHGLDWSAKLWIVISFYFIFVFIYFWVINKGVFWATKFWIVNLRPSFNSQISDFFIRENHWLRYVIFTYISSYQSGVFDKFKGGLIRKFRTRTTEKINRKCRKPASIKKTSLYSNHIKS